MAHTSAGHTQMEAMGKGGLTLLAGVLAVSLGCSNEAALTARRQISAHRSTLKALEPYRKDGQKANDALRALVLDRIKETGGPPVPYEPWPPSAIPRQPVLQRIRSVGDIPIPELSDTRPAVELPAKGNAAPQDLASKHNELVKQVRAAGEKVVDRVNGLIDVRNERLRQALAKWQAQEEGAAPPMQPQVRIVGLNTKEYAGRGKGEPVVLALELSNEGDGPAHRVSVFLRDEERGPAWRDYMPQPSATIDWLEPKTSRKIEIVVRLPAGVGGSQSRPMLINCRARDGWHCVMDEVLFWLHVPCHKSGDKPKVGRVWRADSQ